ncbi:MAG: hypothetical protein IJ446_11665 [Oscillospiraceae bacterium]|nr:hypothetical protein [Oscillospiraceae bacterium]
MFGKLYKRIISGITALAMCSAVSAYPVKAYTDGYIIVYDNYVYYWENDYPYENEIIIEEAPVIEEEYISTEKTKKSDAELDLSVSERSDKEINLKWNKIDGAKTYKLYFYNDRKGKYSLYKKYSEDSVWGSSFYERIDGLKSDKTYKFFVKAYDKKGSLIDSNGISTVTLAAAPALNIAMKKNYIQVSWKPLQENADGYELYKMKDDYMKYSAPSSFYSGMSGSDLKKYDFTLTEKSSSKAAKTMKLKKSASYTFIVRTYTVENGKKKYSAFSEAYHTQSPSAYVNALTLKPEKIVYGEEYELVKKYVNSVIDDDMTNIQKLQAIFDLVHSHGTYQTDINKIDGNRPVWQIMVKGEGQCASWAFCLDAMLEYAGFNTRVVRGTRPSGQHFWCQLKLNGKWYDLDAQLGDFLIEYTDCSSHDYVVKEAF